MGELVKRIMDLGTVPEVHAGMNADFTIMEGEDWNNLWKVLEEAKKEFLDLYVRILPGWDDILYVCIPKKKIDEWFLKWFGKTEV